MQSFFKFIGLKFAALVAALAPAGCSASGGTDPQWLMQVAQTQQAANSPATSYGSYALRPNDQVRVQVYNEPDITGDYQVDSAGYLYRSEMKSRSRRRQSERSGKASCCAGLGNAAASQGCGRREVVVQ
jgi:hypothetical protein